jgi:hypothetical protein
LKGDDRNKDEKGSNQNKERSGQVVLRNGSPVRRFFVEARIHKKLVFPTRARGQVGVIKLRITVGWVEG